MGDPHGWHCGDSHSEEVVREQLKALSKETLIYGASTMIGKFLSFLLVPFYVNVLRNASEYGISTTLFTYASFLNIIFTLGLEAAYFRYAAKGEGEERSMAEERRLFSSPFIVVLLFGGTLSLLMYTLAPSLAWPIFHDPKVNITPMLPMLTRILQLGAGIVLLDSLTVLPFAVLRLDHRARWFATIRFTNIALTIALNFLFILGFHWGVEGIFRANLIASSVMMSMLLPTIWRRLEWRITPSVIKKLLPFGLTNVPAYIGAMMVQVIDRPIVQAYLGLAMLGIYQANYRMGLIMMVFVSLFEYAWRPFFLRQARTDDARARVIFSRVFTYFMLIALVAFLFLSLALPYLVSHPLPFIHRRLLTKEYLPGMNIIPVVLAAYIFQGMYTNFIAGIYISEQNRKLPLITGIGAAVNIISNLLLIPMLGIMGAALATLFAYMAMALAIYIIAQKAYPIAYDWRRVGKLAVIVLAAYSIEELVVGLQLISGGLPLLGMRMGIFASSIAAIYFSDFFSKGELAFLAEVSGKLGIGKRVLADRAPQEPLESAREREEG